VELVNRFESGSFCGTLIEIGSLSGKSANNCAGCFVVAPAQSRQANKSSMEDLTFFTKN